MQLFLCSRGHGRHASTTLERTWRGGGKMLYERLHEVQKQTYEALRPKLWPPNRNGGPM